MTDQHAQPAGHPDMDYEEHERTYKMFLNLLKYSALVSLGLLAALAFFLG
jgi:hypothetical protein